VTVCIAVLPRFSDTIVLVSDELLSSQDISVEGVMKWAPIEVGTEWYAMFAGEASRFPTLMARVREVLGDARNRRLTLPTVTAAFEAAYLLEARTRVETEILRPYGMSQDDFIQKGKRLLGEVRFNAVADDVVAAADLGIEMLVAGLDAWGRTQLFSVTPRGVITPAALPYHAIGAGAFVALGTLYPLPHFPMGGPELAATVYRACAAKFAAESAPSVGKSTHVMIVSPMAGTWTMLMEIEGLRELWRTRGQPPVPSRAEASIARDLKRLVYRPEPHRRDRKATGRRPTE
jgi:20S proteasome alpha/beta subunit